MSWRAGLRWRYSGAFALIGFASFLGFLLHEGLDSELDTFAGWSARKPGVESNANTVTRVGNERRESHGQGATTDPVRAGASSSAPQLVRPTPEGEIARILPWYDDVFRPKMHLRGSGFVDVDWRLFEDIVGSGALPYAPPRIGIDLGIAVPVVLVVDGIARNEANTVTGVSGEVFRDDRRVGSAVLRPSLERKQFRGYVRTPEGKFIIAPTPRPPAHVVYVNDWDSIKEADERFLTRDPDYIDRNDGLD